MKKALPLVLTIAGALLAWQFFRKARTSQLLNVKIRNLKLQPINQAAIQIEVINPTDTAIEFTSITGDIIVNDFAIATLNYQAPTNINANSAVMLNLRIKINPLQLAQLTGSSLINKSREYKILFNGNVSAQGVNIPVQTEQTLKF